MRSVLIFACVLLIGACGGAAPGSPSVQPVFGSAAATVVPTEAATPPPTVAPTATPAEITVGSGSEAATEFAVAEGSLGMSVDEYIANYNRFVDQDTYPIIDPPTQTSEQVYEVTPEGATNTVLLIIANTDGSVRSVTALSDAGSLPDEIDRSMAQLETVFIWSSAAAAASPNLSEAERNNLLGTIGVEGGRPFGTYAVATDVGPVRYVLIEADDVTELIIREAN